MTTPDATMEEVTNVRWTLPNDVIDIIRSHQNVLQVKLKKKFVSQNDAAIDLIRSRKLPKVVIIKE